MERIYEAGVPVVYVDTHGVRRHALVTTWHCTSDRAAWLATGAGETCCNLVWVSSDPKRTDSYGQQLIRESSVVHQGSQPAHGSYWLWPDE